MKSVLLSIRPGWCLPIIQLIKTLEIRKNCPNLKTPFKVYIYCTSTGDALCPPHINCDKWSIHEHVCKNSSPRTMTKQEREKSDYYYANGKVIGEFICDNIISFDVPYPAFMDELDKDILSQSGCTYYQLHRYAYHDTLYGWHISELEIYKTPKPLSEFHKYGYEDDYESYSNTCSGGIPMIFNEESYKISNPPQSWFYVDELI